MAVSPVEYRHEYVSGAITVPAAAFPVLVLAQVANRSETVGRARVRVWNQHTLLPESQDATVDPDDVWIYEEAPPVVIQGIDPKHNTLWVQIRTTLPDLVPTLAVKETVRGPEGEAQGFRESHFFTPGDFAAFALHPVPFNPPVPGPLAEA